MGHGHVGAGHRFLAPLCDRDAVPARVLAGMVEPEGRLVAAMDGAGYRTPTTDAMVGGQVRPRPAP